MQRIVDARLPAITTGAQRAQHIDIQSQLHSFLGGRSLGPAPKLERSAGVAVGRLKSEKASVSSGASSGSVQVTGVEGFRGHWLS